MAERLTEHLHNMVIIKKCYIEDYPNRTVIKPKGYENGFYYGEAIDKLAQIEDIMYRYAIEDLQKLDKILINLIQFAHEHLSENCGTKIVT